MKTIIFTLFTSAFCCLYGLGQCSNSIVFNEVSKSVFLQPYNTYYTGNNGGFTWECWFKLNEPLGSEIRPLIVASDAVIYEDIWLGFGWDGGMFNQPASKLVFKVDGPNSATPVSPGCVYEPSGGFQVGTWYHVAGVMNYSTHTISLFVNGQQVDSQTSNVAPIVRVIPTSLSCPEVENGQLTLNGNMDEVKIWTKSLSGTEIAANYLLCRSGMESNLEIYYHCNEGTGYQLMVNSSSIANLGNGTLPPIFGGGIWSHEGAPLTDDSCTPHCDFCPSLYTGPGNLVICAGDSILLSAEPGFNFYNWWANGELDPSSGSSSSGLMVAPATTTTYTIIAATMGYEMVVNPDFSQGNVGFTSGYNYSNVYNPCNYYVGNQYFTLPDPAMVDHTPTNDNMMISFDGCSGGEILWEQTFTIVPNAGYTFNFWATRTEGIHPVFQTTMTGDITGPEIMTTFNGLPTTGNQWIWDHYEGGFGVFSSGNNHTITITVRDIEMNGGDGNDFAMDDFSLRMECAGIEQVTVYVNSMPLDLGPDVAVCEGTSHVIHAGNSSASYLWSDGSTADSLIVSDPGTYWVTVQDNCGGTQSDTVQITSIILPVLNLGNDISICTGDTTHFSTATGFDSYVWTGAGLSCTACANPDVFPTVSTDYILEATTSEGCTVTDSVAVTIVPLPQVDLGNDLFICSGENVSLNTVVPLNNYQWSPAVAINCTNCSNPIVNPTVSTTYILTAGNALGCTSSDSVEVHVSPLSELGLGDDLTICKGESTQIQFTPDPMFTTFLWTPATGLSCSACADPEATPSGTVLYSLQATTAAGCTTTDSITVIVQDNAPEVLVVVTDVTCEEPGAVAVEAIGDGSGELQYNFNHLGYSVNPFYSPVAVGDYTLFVRNGEEGCPFKTVVVVEGEDGVVFIPNVFTPDGNQVNATWGIQGMCISKINCRIFNRWGEEIATLTDLSQQWDGTFNGEIVPDGVYTYTVEVTYVSEYVVITGSVAVLR